MELLSNKIDKEDLKPGDHIYSWRRSYLYAHHGIYVGEEEVIHFTSGVPGLFSSGSSRSRSKTPCERCRNDKRLGGVKRTCLDCFLSGGNLYLFKYDVSRSFFKTRVRGGTCTPAKCDQPADVLRRASYLHQNGFGDYNLFANNCEDFAVYCKTGLLVVGNTHTCWGSSGQVTSFLSGLFGGPVTWYKERYRNDIGIRLDVAEVLVEEVAEFSQLINGIRDDQVRATVEMFAERRREERAKNSK